MSAILRCAFYEVVMSDVEKKDEKTDFLLLFSLKKLLETYFKFCSLLNNCWNVFVMRS